MVQPQNANGENEMIVHREDYILSRLLISEGHLSHEKLVQVIDIWQKKHKEKRLIKALIEEKTFEYELLRQLETRIGRMLEKPESDSVLEKLDTIFCGIAVKNRLVSPEAVKICRKKAQKGPPGTLLVSQTLIKERYLDAKFFFELKLQAEIILYSWKLKSLLQNPKKEKKATGQIPEQNKMDIRPAQAMIKATRSSIPESVAAVKAAMDKRLDVKKGPRTSDPIPEHFANYIILEEVAIGGMGTIYKAVQKGLDRIVALKVLRRKEESEDRIKRFKREADAVSRLNHPNIVRLHEVDVWQGRHYFSMDFIDGIPLDVLIKESDVALDDLIQVEVEMAEAIHYAHKHGVIHRDLKPANVIVDMDGHPQITDFGLAKIVDCNTLLTKSDTILGTPYYMAPEQTRGDVRKISPKTDVWGLGVILYEMVTGSIPFKAQSTIELYHKINHLDPPLPRSIRPDIPEDIQNIILKAIEKETTHRYPSAEAFAEDLKRYLSGKSISAKKIPEWRKNLRKLLRRRKVLDITAGAVLLIIGCLILYFFWQYLESKQSEKAEEAEKQKKIQEERRLKEEERRKAQLRETLLFQANSQLNEARNHTSKEEYGKALDCLVSAIKLVPDFSEAYIQRIKIHLQIASNLTAEKESRKKEYIRKALEDIDTVLQLQTGHLDAYRLRAKISIDSQDYEKAASDLERAIELSPKDYNLLMECVSSYIHASQQDPNKRTVYLRKAIPHLNDAMSANSNDKFEILSTRGNIYEQLGEKKKALDDWEAAIALNPEKSSELKEKIQNLKKP